VTGPRCPRVAKVRVSSVPGSSRAGDKPSADAFDAIDPVEIYASAIDTSDYVSQLAPAIRSMIGAAGCLLDVGAGGGQLGAALDPSAWTVIEPNANMRARLKRFSPPPKIFAQSWREAKLKAGSFDTVLAATMPAIMQEPSAFLAHCLKWSRGLVIWVVPSHRGPRGLVLAGCLLREWHNEDETPGIEITMAQLAGSPSPRRLDVDWTFSAVTADLGRTANFLCGRLGWSSLDTRRNALLDHLAAQAKSVRGGYRLDIPRKSAVLIWG
jgi:hypothetical protein